jgi:hypothetical protein
LSAKAILSVMLLITVWALGYSYGMLSLLISLSIHLPSLSGSMMSLSLDTLQVNRCLSIKGAEDILNKPHAFEVSTTDDSMFFIADTDKVCLMSPHRLPTWITTHVRRKLSTPATPA